MHHYDAGGGVLDRGPQNVRWIETTAVDPALPHAVRALDLVPGVEAEYPDFLVAQANKPPLSPVLYIRQTFNLGAAPR